MLVTKTEVEKAKDQQITEMQNLINEYQESVQAKDRRIVELESQFADDQN